MAAHWTDISSEIRSITVIMHKNGNSSTRSIKNTVSEMIQINMKNRDVINIM